VTAELPSFTTADRQLPLGRFNRHKGRDLPPGFGMFRTRTRLLVFPPKGRYKPEMAAFAKKPQQPRQSDDGAAWSGCETAAGGSATTGRIRIRPIATKWPVNRGLMKRKEDVTPGAPSVWLAGADRSGRQAQSGGQRVSGSPRRPGPDAISAMSDITDCR
jgi:hypothetical protein